MSRSICVCFLAVGVLAVFLMSAGATQGDQNTATAREMVRNNGDPTVSKDTKEANIERLANFYKQYRDRIQFNATERQWTEELLKKYNVSLLGGAPLLEGTSLITSSNQTNIEVRKKKKKKKKKNAAPDVKINPGTTLFGLATIITFYVFRSI